MNTIRITSDEHTLDLVREFMSNLLETTTWILTPEDE